MKELYAFNINKSIEVEIKINTPDGTLLKKEIKEVPVKIILKSPSRLDKENAAAFEATEWSKAVRDGILTKQMLAKIYSDNGGILSKEDIKKSTKLIEEYNLKILEWQQATIDKADEAKLELLKNEVSSLYSQVQIIDTEREELFRNSAETRARDKTIQWLILFLTFVEENGKPVPFFGSGDFEEKLNKLYELSENEDKFNKEVLEKAALYISFWYMGRLSAKEDFEYLNTELNKSEQVDETKDAQVDE